MPRVRSAASALLLFTGVAHLLYYFAGPGAAGGPGMAVFVAIDVAAVACCLCLIAQRRRA